MTRRTLSAILADAGAAFCLIPAKSKAPVYKAWQRTPKTAAEALAHARGGGNVGLLTGKHSGGLVILDYDRDVDQVLAKFPALATTIRIFRQNAPERAKFIVRVVGELPTSRKHECMEILADGRQGIIHGMHATGARIEWEGQQILELTAGDIGVIWEAVTGTPAHGHQVDAQAGPHDAEAVASGVALVDQVLQLAGVAHGGWKEHDGSGRKAILSTCPFNPADDPHEADEAAFVVVGADGRLGAGCHHARCQHVIASSGGSGWAYLKHAAGYEPAAAAAPAGGDLAEIRNQVDALREWIRRADFAEHVPVVLQAANGYRTGGTDKAMADAILALAHERGRLAGLILPIRTLRQLTGLGSLQTAQKALQRLVGWFVVEEAAEDGRKRFRIADPLVAWARESCADRTSFVFDLDLDLPDNLRVRSTQQIFGALPLTTHRAHDAFVASASPITQDELQARIDARSEEIAAALASGVTPPEPINPWRYRRRLRATLPTAGRAALLVVDALAECGGGATYGMLRELCCMSKHALSRAVGRLVDLGLATRDGHRVALVEEFDQVLAEVSAEMPTAGIGDERLDADMNATIRWGERELKRPDLEADAAQRLHRRVAWAYRRKAEIAARAGHRTATRQAPPNMRHVVDIGIDTPDRATAGKQIHAKQIRPRLTEEERFIRRKFGQLTEDAAALWGLFNGYMAREVGTGWWTRLTQAEVLKEFYVWQGETTGGIAA